MTDAELNERVARARGWTYGANPIAPEGWENPLEPGYFYIVLPKWASEPEDFCALLEWHAKEGRGVTLDNFGWDEKDPEGETVWWRAQIRVDHGDDADFYSGMDTTPARALALATVAWKEAS